jgi:hypothetical protein
MPPGPSSHMTPTAVSTPPASRGRQRARTARAKGLRPTTVSSAPVRIHLRIRLLRVNGGAPYLPAISGSSPLSITEFPRLGSACRH